MRVLPDNLIKKINVSAKRLMNAIEKSYGFTNFNIKTNVGNLAGQEIFHYHLHIIPRTSKEYNKPNFDAKDLDIIANKISSNF